MEGLFMNKRKKIFFFFCLSDIWERKKKKPIARPIALDPKVGNTSN